eukprot:GHVR01125364.1.p1 GENE.GHVR01125364.1~~GHVR01125364.1.p1  ORF type:complete len:108 (+),score=9.99 GHVR01125364.1:61-384(+)
MRERVISTTLKSYSKETDTKVKLLDTLILYALFITLIMVMYIMVAGSDNYNSFISSIVASTGTATFAMCLRMQLSNPDTFKVSSERAFAEFLIGNFLMIMAVTNFLG